MKVPYGSNSYSHVLCVFKFTTDKVSLKAALFRPNSKVSRLEHAKLWGRVRLGLRNVVFFGHYPELVVVRTTVGRHLWLYTQIFSIQEVLKMHEKLLKQQHHSKPLVGFGF